MSAQPDLFREDEHARQRRLMRAWILNSGLAEEPSGCTTVTIRNFLTPKGIAMLTQTTDWFGNRLLRAVLVELSVLSPRYSQLTEQEQNDTIDRLRGALEDEIRQLVHAVAAQSRTFVAAKLVSVTFKDGVKGVIDLGEPGQPVLELALNCAKPCIVVLADPEAFTAGMEHIRGEPAQRDAFPDAEVIA